MTSREVPFYIPATGTPSRRRLTLKHNDTFAVFDNHGDIGASAGGTDGLFDRDTRFLSQLRLLINGQHPVLLGSAIRDDNLTLQVDLTNADVFEADRLLLPKDTVHIARTIYLSDGSRREHMTIFNRGAEDIRHIVAGLRERFRRHFRSARKPAQSPRYNLEQSARDGHGRPLLSRT
jgi:glycogen debranching enzyme